MPVKSFKPSHSSGVGRSFNGRQKILNLYDTAWEHYRLRFLKENPRCYGCGQTATVVDHLRPHQGDENLFRQLDNHIPLCKTCHDTATGLFDKRFRTGGSIKNKIEWLQWRRAARDLSFRVKVLPYYGPER